MKRAIAAVSVLLALASMAAAQTTRVEGATSLPGVSTDGNQGLKAKGGLSSGDGTAVAGFMWCSQGTDPTSLIQTVAPHGAAFFCPTGITTPWGIQLWTAGNVAAGVIKVGAKSAVNGVDVSVGSVGTVTEDDQSFSDVTTGDVGTSKHGYAPKAPNDATRYLNGKSGAWTSVLAATPVTNIAAEDVVCSNTNTSPYTCTGVSNTETFFGTGVTIPGTGSAGLFDGTHHGIALTTVLDWVSAAGAARTYNLYSCTDSTCATKTRIFQFTGSGTTSASVKGYTSRCEIFGTATASTLVVACTATSGPPGGGSNPQLSSIVASTKNTGSNWVLKWSVTLPSSANDAAALTAMYGRWIE